MNILINSTLHIKVSWLGFLVNIPEQNESVTHRTDRECCRVALVHLGAEGPQGLGE